MTRDYSQFFPKAAQTPATANPLLALGWHPHFASQIESGDLDARPPIRVTEVQRSGLTVAGDGIETTLPPRPDATVGDWLLLDPERPGDSQLLERRSLLRRRAPGTGRQVQLIAANIDTLFVVTSCNADFNVARLERYIALAFEAEIDPVILLTKADLAEDADRYAAEAGVISERVPVVTLDARGTDPDTRLAPWTKPGRTVAFLGSSGVGKSTLTNALLGRATLATQGIREDDAKGRHTTTARQLHRIPGRGCVLDTPGMRELRLTDVADGIGNLFADLVTLAAECRFRDCAHESEPGCAVRAAIAEGTLDAARLARWRKLQAEERFNAASLAERRASDRDFTRMVRRVMKEKPNRR
ncbi:ribosome small subunit-dependent GTPase A [Jannaschia marina]|uniref:ribosome small subunit-dependent GTPase A n=1 Tax=Jannaschia marina TaxID=2741674 RepID=UPI0015C75304|nr:ribosome small subunit-dependent GTPase A [Jannaschia marina]